MPMSTPSRPARLQQRTGRWFYAGEYDNTEVKEFNTYRGVAGDDWVLVLEDAALDLPVGPA
jgi:hypothetical protein